MRRSELTAFKEDSPSSNEEIEEGDISASDDGDSDDQDIDATPIQHKKRAKSTHDSRPSSNAIVETSFDAYFTYNSSRAQTSTNVFSKLVLPLTPEEYSEAIRSAASSLKSVEPAVLADGYYTKVFSRYMSELNEGFNILCYGFGSKRDILNKFATECCAKAGHVVVINAFQPSFVIKDLFTSIENVPGVLDQELTSTAIEKQARRIYDFFAGPSQGDLYLIIHNIDAAPLRNPKAEAHLSLLAHNPRIHIVASIDHINAPLLWSSSESSSRKPHGPTADSTTSRGFAWLWHDLTTLASYDFELAFADRSSISGAHGGGARRKNDALAPQNATAMSETAARHILASVTQKAQKLFLLLGNKQLESIEEAGDDRASDLQQFAMAYDTLFNNARDNFIATNDTALRSLLGEFRDHGLIVSAQAGSGSGEVLWIPLRRERLTSVLQTLQIDK